MLAGGSEAVHYHRLVARGKEPAVAIVAVARRLTVLAYCLLTRETPYRGLDRAKYVTKLARLARHQPASDRAGDTQIGWARAQVAALAAAAPAEGPCPAGAGAGPAQEPGPRPPLRASRAAAGADAPRGKDPARGSGGPKARPATRTAPGRERLRRGKSGSGSAARQRDRAPMGEKSP